MLMVGTKGVLSCGIFGRYLRIYDKKGKVSESFDGHDYDWSLPPLNSEYGHQASWAAACKAGFGSPEHLALTSSFDHSGPLTETVLMGNLAIRSYGYRTTRADGSFEFSGRKKLLWDGANMRITNFEPANQFVKEEYRKW
jgi:hypothetical protein